MPERPMPIDNSMAPPERDVPWRVTITGYYDNKEKNRVELYFDVEDEGPWKHAYRNPAGGQNSYIQRYPNCIPLGYGDTRSADMTSKRIAAIAATDGGNDFVELEAAFWGDNLDAFVGRSTYISTITRPDGRCWVYGVHPSAAPLRKSNVHRVEELPGRLPAPGEVHIIVDDRQHEGMSHHAERHNVFTRYGVPWVVRRLDVGDYVRSDHPLVAIDTKHGLNELAYNLCGGPAEEARFAAEIARARDNGVFLRFLVVEPTPVLEWRHPDCRTCAVPCDGQTCALRGGPARPGWDELSRRAAALIERYPNTCDFVICRTEEEAAQHILMLFGWTGVSGNDLV